MLNRHLLAYLPVYLGQALVGFGSVIVFTRVLSPDAYGRYMLVLTAAALISTAVFTWLDAAVARFHARAAARGRLNGHVFTAFRLFALLALGVAGLGGLLLVVLPLSAPLTMSAAFALAYILIRAGLMIALESRRAAGQAWRYSALESFTLAGGFGFGVAFSLFTDWGAAAPIAGLALASLLAALVDVPVLLKDARPDRADAARTKVFFAFGGPIAFSLIFELLLTSGDRFLIAAFLGEAATGAYAAGYAISDRSLSIVFHWVSMTAGPLLILALENEGADRARAVAKRMGALMMALTAPAAAGLALIAGPLTQLMVGEALAGPAAMIMPLIAVSGLINGVMTHYFHTAYTLGRRTGAMAVIMSGFAVVNLGLNVVLIPVMGLIGAAWATVITYALALGVCVFHGRTVFVMPLPVREWSKAGLSTLVMGAAILLTPAPVAPLGAIVVKVGLGVVIYGLMMLALNGLQSRDWIHQRLRAASRIGAAS